MSKAKIVLNRAGVREMLRSNEMLGICKEYADHAVNRLGSGYEVTTYTGKNRVNAAVETATYRAMRDNMQNNSILKALK